MRLAHTDPHGRDRRRAEPCEGGPHPVRSNPQPRAGSHRDAPAPRGTLAVRLIEPGGQQAIRPRELHLFVTHFRSPLRIAHRDAALLDGPGSCKIQAVSLAAICGRGNQRRAGLRLGLSRTRRSRWRRPQRGARRSRIDARSFDPAQNRRRRPRLLHDMGSAENDHRKTGENRRTSLGDRRRF